MNGKIMPVELCSAIGKCMSHPSSYGSSLPSYTEKTTARIAALALQQLEAARARDVATHEKNQPALEANKAVQERVVALMAEIGMPASYTEKDASSRSRYPKTVRRSAGYLSDLLRECRTDDSFIQATATYERLKREYEAYAAKGQEEAAQALRLREAEQAALTEKRKADMELAAILLRYELPIESSWGDVLEALRGRDQRVDLAVAMMATRGDWSDGCYRVTGALKRFTIRTDEDKEIAADVLGCTAEFEDGRVFRDTSWSYDAIMASLQDRQLAADALLAYRRAENDR